MVLRVLKGFLAMLIGMTPGVAYYLTDMVGVGGALCLATAGGFVGLALTLPRVSARRVIYATAMAALEVARTSITSKVWRPVGGVLRPAASAQPTTDR